MRATDASPPFARGARIGKGGRFEIVDLLGRGGASVVFRVRDRIVKQTWACKVVLPLDAEGEETTCARARLEADALARLDHENVVRVETVGVDRGLPWILLEYLQGETLEHRLELGAPTSEGALRIAEQVTHGLAHAHERGVLHLDVKPGNVFLLDDDRVKLIDFGIGACSAGGSPPGAPRAFAGTPGYMAPEQWCGKAVDARTDFWALGVMLFEMLGGDVSNLPVGPWALRGSVLAVGKSEHVGSHTLRSPRLHAFFQRALALRAELRFQSASELVSMLGDVAEELAQARLRAGADDISTIRGHDRLPHRTAERLADSLHRLRERRRHEPVAIDHKNK